MEKSPYCLKRLITGITPSPCVVGKTPPGRKQCCTSMISSADFGDCVACVTASVACPEQTIGDDSRGMITHSKHTFTEDVKVAIVFSASFA